MFYRPLVHRDSQTAYFYRCHAFDEVPRALLLDKLKNFKLLSFYVYWFQIYLSNRSSFVYILRKQYFPFLRIVGSAISFHRRTNPAKLINLNLSYFRFKTVNLCKLITTQQNSGVKTLWNTTFRKAKLCFTFTVSSVHSVTVSVTLIASVVTYCVLAQQIRQ